MVLRRSNDLSPVVTVLDVSNPDLLVRLLRDMSDKVNTINTRIDTVETAPKQNLTQQDLNHIQNSLQSTGTHPLNLTGLKGLQGDVSAAVIPLPSLPTGLALQTYKDSQLLLITKSPLELWVVRGGSPNTATQLI